MDNEELTDPRIDPDLETAPPAEKRESGPSEQEKPSEEAGQGDDYPLRPPKDDPRWAVNTVRIWLGFALISLAFILALMVLGIFYD